MPKHRGVTVSVADLLPGTEAPYGASHQRAAALATVQGDRTVVYAVRLSDGVIKIGCTADLAKRLNTLRCHNRSATSDVLAFRFGDEADEAAIHEALRPYRARGHEYYHPRPEVLAVVNEMREDFGLPPIAA